MNQILKFKKAATNCFEATPLGNGRIGALVFGQPGRERIVLNEDTLWSGFDRNTRKAHASDSLAELRSLLERGEYERAQQLAEEKMLGNGYSESYMPMCDLNITLEDTAEVSAYCRTLSLSEGVCEVRFVSGNVSCKERSFVSFPDDVFVWEFEASGGTKDLNIQAESLLKHQVKYENDSVILTGLCPDHVLPDYVTNAENPVEYSNEKGLRFCAFFQIGTDGRISSGENGITVSDAHYCRLIGTSHNTFDTVDYSEKCRVTVQKAAQNPEELAWRHGIDFRALADRMKIRLESAYTDEYDVDELQRITHSGSFSNRAIEMLFLFGRYLLISSSRQGQPANLQGIWNWLVRPPWSANWTTNINVQMNYWPAECCNLSELTTPLFDWIKRLIPSGTQTAKEYYLSDGWCVHHNVDVWGITSPAMDEAHYAFWPMAGVWLCQHLYRHWQYTNDRAFLRDTFLPVVSGAVRFCLDLLVEDENGELVTSPSTSPENIFRYNGGAKKAAITRGSACDMTMVGELFGYYLSACRECQVENELTREVSAAQKRLKPLQIKDGLLLEWGLPFEENDAGHRHFSPLYGIFPGDSLLDREEMMQAGKNLFHRRLANNGCIGWSTAWAVCLASRFKEPEIAAYQLKHLISSSFSYNLFSIYIPSESFPESRHDGFYIPEQIEDVYFQIDANFGVVAAVSECLLRSVGAKTELLPCLPEGIPDGEICGLRTTGDITLDLSWSNGELKRAVLYTGANCVPEKTVCYRHQTKQFSLLPKHTYEIILNGSEWTVNLLD